MRAFGAPAEDIEAVEAALQQQRDAAAAQEQQAFVVYHDNWLTVQTFLRCQTQWLRAGMAGQRSGLNYPGIEVVLQRTVKRKHQRDVFEGLQTMELAVLAYDSEQAAKD